MAQTQTVVHNKMWAYSNEEDDDEVQNMQLNTQGTNWVCTIRATCKKKKKKL